MPTYEVNLIFKAAIQVEAEDENEVMEKAIENARANYGSEVADYGAFTVIRNRKGD